MMSVRYIAEIEDSAVFDDPDGHDRECFVALWRLSPADKIIDGDPDQRSLVGQDERRYSADKEKGPEVAGAILVWLLTPW